MTETKAVRDAALHIALLGGFRVAAGEWAIDPATWRRRKARHLVALLALAPGHALHRDHLIDLLWPEADPAAAANSLYQTLHRVRRGLEAAIPGAGARLRLQAEMVSLGGDAPIEVDALAFEAAASRARRGDPRGADEAIALYAGDLLPADRYEDWVAPRREALRETFLSLLLDIARAREVAGDVPAAIAALERLVDADPTHEAGARELIRLLAASGQRPAALRRHAALVQTLAQELDAEPEPATNALRDEVAHGEVASLPVAPPSTPTNITPYPTSFIGREREVAEVHRLLARTRVLTLTGPGGSGKTRLALEAAGNLPERLPGGIWLVDLSAITDPALVPREVATTLAIPDVPDEPLPSVIGRALASRRMVLVLDNGEHLVAACADLVTGLLRTTRDVRFLVTSREPLRVPGEVTLPVPSLTLPRRDAGASAAEVLASESARLLVDRVQAVRPDVSAGELDATAIAQVCHRLDGIPLAIELAAARARALSLEQIAERLDDRFRLLACGNRTAPTRQQTLKGAIDWSHDLLDAAERRLFREVSVFAGGFDLAAAEAICSNPSLDVLDVLARLVEKSLVQADTSRPRTRYRLLESIREYAAAHLAASGDEEAIRDRHAGIFLHLAETAAPSLRTAAQGEWLGRLETEHDNLRAALHWLRRADKIEDELRLAGTLAWFWHRGGHPSEGRQRLAAALARPAGSTSPARAGALLGAGVITVIQGDLAQGAAWLREAAAAPDARISALSEIWLTWPTLFQQGPGAAAPRARQALVAARLTDDPWSLGLALLANGFVASEAADLAAARAHFAEASALFQTLGDPWGIATALTEGARVAYRAGEPDAQALAAEAVAVSRAMGDRWQTVQALGLLVEIERAVGTLDAAWTDGLEVVALAEEIGQHASAGWAHRDLGYVALARGDRAEAHHRFLAGKAIFGERGYKLGMACCLIGLATCAAASDPTAAATLLGTSQRLRDETATSLAPADLTVAGRLEHDLRGQLGDGAFEEAFTAGLCAGAEEREGG